MRQFKILDIRFSDGHSECLDRNGVKEPGLARGPDIKQEPSHPKPGIRLWRGSCPSAPQFQRKEGCGGLGHAGLMGLGAYRSLTFSIMPLPHSVPMEAGGMGGVTEPFFSP